MKDKGFLVVISGPAGTGKGTVVKELAKENNVEVSISATTRAPRGNEKDGVEYHFLSRGQFESIIENDGFLEYAEYCGNYYGSPKKQAEEWISEGKDVILEIEVQGFEKIKKKNPECISIFIMPPSFKELERRLRKRATDSEESILKRLERAKEEVKIASDYDYIIVNGSVEKCAADIKSVLYAEKLKSKRFDVDSMF